MNINSIINPNLISFDVKSLFPNVPIDLASKYFNSHYNSINCSLPKDVVVQLVKFVFDNSYFILDSSFHEQLYGCPMGSRLSPIMADIALAQLEAEVRPNLGLLDFTLFQICG